MAGPRFIRNNYSDLYGEDMLPALEELFRSELKTHPSRREQLFKVVSTDMDIWQASELHDMPLMKQVSEGEDYSFEAPAQGASKTLKPVKYGLGFSISEEAVDDGKFAFISDAIAKLAKSARESQEIQAMNIFNNGFSTETTADGVAVFSTSHTLPSGGTIRNKLSSDADLSVTSLEQMLVDFETQFVGDSGIINLIRPKYLVVAPTNKRLAMELIGSELKATTATAGTDGITNVNNMNSLKSDGLIVVSSPHLTDTDAWFLTADPSETGLRIVSRKPIETKAAAPDVGFKNDSILYKTRYREKIGVTHANGIFGTSGGG
jgi:hypothetical protein